jgi:hypothetical protein
VTKYLVKLSEQEELSLRQLATQPGFDVIFKFLQGESLDAQSAAMDCEDLDERKRLVALSDAQRTAKVVSNLIRKLAAYREAIQAPIEEKPEEELFERLWDAPERTH